MPNQYRTRRKLNANPLRKVVGTIQGDEVCRTEDAVYYLTYEKLECGHRGPSVLSRNEWFGAGSAKRRRCAECGKEASDGD